MARSMVRRRRSTSVDSITKEKRSWVMSRVGGKNTGPEMVVRRIVHAMGYRYRLHQAKLPGKPDLVFAGRRAVIFVHGCFWHRHDDCKLARMPKSRLEFWGPKLKANKIRDARKIEELKSAGWRVLVVWECELVDTEGLRSRLAGFLEGDDAGS
jgi:DNA mismatch endonuclease, patch repair protein